MRRILQSREGFTRDVRALGVSVTNPGMTPALSGNLAGSRSVYDEMRSRAVREYVPPMCLALLAASIGELEEVIVYGRESVRRLDPQLVIFAIIWVGGGAHGIPEYSDMSVEIGLPEWVRGEGTASVALTSNRPVAMKLVCSIARRRMLRERRHDRSEGSGVVVGVCRLTLAVLDDSVDLAIRSGRVWDEFWASYLDSASAAMSSRAFVLCFPRRRDTRRPLLAAAAAIGRRWCSRWRRRGRCVTRDRRSSASD